MGFAYRVIRASGAFIHGLRENVTVIGKWKAEARRKKGKWVENKKVEVYHHSSFLILSVGLWTWAVCVNHSFRRALQDPASRLPAVLVLLCPPAIYLMWFMRERKKIVANNFVLLTGRVGNAIIVFPYQVTSVEKPFSIFKFFVGGKEEIRSYISPQWPDICVGCGSQSPSEIGHLKFSTQDANTHTLTSTTLSVPLCEACFREGGGYHAGDSKLFPMKENVPDVGYLISFSIDPRNLLFKFVNARAGVMFQAVNPQAKFLCSDCYHIVPDTNTVCGFCGLEQPERFINTLGDPVVADSDVNGP